MKFYPTPEPEAKSENRTNGGGGLANELRPGLGTSLSKPPEAKRATATDFHSDEPKARPYAYSEPRPEPREQPSDPLAQEEERSTGVSGHSSNS